VCLGYPLASRALQQPMVQCVVQQPIRFPYLYLVHVLQKIELGEKRPIMSGCVSWLPSSKSSSAAANSIPLPLSCASNLDSPPLSQAQVISRERATIQRALSGSFAENDLNNKASIPLARSSGNIKDSQALSQLQVIFRKTATSYRSLLRKITCKIRHQIP